MPKKLPSLECSLVVPSCEVRLLFSLQRLCERGAQMGLRAGWEQPNWFARPGDEPGYKPSFRRTNWFEPVGRECDMVLSKVGIIDLSPYGKIEVKGKDASSFMDMIFANELPKVSVMFENIKQTVGDAFRHFNVLKQTQLARF